MIVTKSLNGFADRLQILSDAMEYCLRNKATMCVDWRDFAWGQGEKDFHDYFEIHGIDTITMDDLVANIDDSVSIYPETWTKESLRKPLNKFIHMTQTYAPLDKEYTPFQQNVVVIKDSFRIYHIKNLTINLSLKKEIQEEIIQRLKTIESPYTCVYFRGTDRLQQDEKTEFLQIALDRYNALLPHQKERCFAISDMKEWIDEWKKLVPTTQLAQPDNIIFKLPRNLTQGTHLLDKDVLEYYEVNKHELNLSTLVDFFILTFADAKIGNKEKMSLFHGMAAFFYDNTGKEGIANWLGGYMPPVAKHTTYKRCNTIDPV